MLQGALYRHKQQHIEQQGDSIDELLRNWFSTRRNANDTTASVRQSRYALSTGSCWPNGLHDTTYLCAPSGRIPWIPTLRCWPHDDRQWLTTDRYLCPSSLLKTCTLNFLLLLDISFSYFCLLYPSLSLTLLLSFLSLPPKFLLPAVTSL